MALVVLGSGATRGAAFVENNVCKPPLNNDFFTQLQRISNSKHIKIIRATIRDVVALFGKNFRITMEEFFTQIEFYLRVLSVARERKGYTRNDLEKIKNNFVTAISAVFEESITKPTCEYHKKLVSALNKDATIISFNYDCLIDYALKDTGENKWNARYGYCFPLKGYKIKGVENWNPNSKSLANQKETIKLLKLHGSLNWQINDTKKIIILKQRLYQTRGTPRFTIIPPEWNKESLRRPTFRRIWKEAASRIHKEKIFVFIGFSFVPTDLYAASLFQISIKEKGIKKLIIVNPDKEARRRTRAILNRGISEDTLIIQYDSLEEFSKADLKILLSEKAGAGVSAEREIRKVPFGEKDYQVDKDELDVLKPISKEGR